MSVGMIQWVWEHSPYGGVDKVIHLAVADSANDMNNNELWARQRWIAEKANVSLKSVSRWMGSAVQGGYLELLEDNSRAGKANRYRMLCPADAPKLWTPKEGREGWDTTTHPAEGGKSPCLTGCDEVTQGGKSPCLTEPEVITQEEPLLPSALSEPCGVTQDEVDLSTNSSEDDAGRASLVSGDCESVHKVDDGGGGSDVDVPPCLAALPGLDRVWAEGLARDWTAAELRMALVSTERGSDVAASWAAPRGKPHDPEVLLAAIALSVAFSEQSNAAGNKWVNPFSKDACRAFCALLVHDEKPESHIATLIRWTFADEFWCTNVRSASKFRAKWDQLRGARNRDLAKRKREENRGGTEDVTEDWMIRTSA